MTGLSVVDLDGDGTVEILRDAISSGEYAYTSIKSPTMSGTLTLPPLNPPPSKWGQPDSSRWMLDLNGDGLLDIAYVARQSPTKIFARLSLGGLGFGQETETTLPVGSRVGQSWIGYREYDNDTLGLWTATFENGGRVADVNRDGRADIVLVDNGANKDGVAARSAVAVLLSNGDGTFSVQASPPPGFVAVPIGDPADGLSSADPVSQIKQHGCRTTVMGDFDGNGLPDFAQMEEGKLVRYLRDSFEPDVVNKIEEGKEGSVVSGQTLAFGYRPMTDSDTYSSDPKSCQGWYGRGDHEHVACVTRGMLLTHFLLVVGGNGSVLSTTYTYANALSDRNGHGFLGFEKVTATTAATSIGTIGTSTTTYTPGYWLRAAGRPPDTYVYPFAFKPQTVTTETETPQGPNTHHETIESMSYTAAAANIPDANPWFGAIGVYPEETTKASFDCPLQASGTCTGTGRLLSYTYQLTTYDAAYGTLQWQFVEHDDPVNPLDFTSSSFSYQPVDADSWLINVPLDRTVSSSVPSTGESSWETASRHVAYTVDPNPNVNTNRPTGAIATETTYAGATPMLVRTFGRDSRGRLTQVSDQDVGTGEYTRTTGYQFEDADGVYVTTTTNPLGHRSRTWRHPGLGVVVEQDDPNGIATATTYDTFGRSVSEIAAGGGTVQTIDYRTSATGGMEVVTTPEGKSTRAVTVHLDPLGREVSRMTPVDATKRLLVTTTYDPLGRKSTITTASLSYTSTNVLNTETFGYDNLGRLLTDRKLPTSNGTTTAAAQPVTAQSVYDGLMVTKTDESSRKTIEVSDGMGRLSTQSAVVAGGATTTATYTYGPFSQLKGMSTEDGSVSTAMEYDGVGRPYYESRNNVGGRTTSYNAFGEVIGTTKVDTQGATVETATYWHDQLGRITTMFTQDGRPPALYREFYYDRAVGGKGIGKMTFIRDDRALTDVQLDYDAAGLLKTKKWLIYSPSFETWIESFVYDPIGRLDTLTYPMSPTETTPLSVKRAYDPYTGDVMSLTDVTDTANMTAPLWQGTTRDERGQFMSESMRMPGTTAQGIVTRSSSYFPQTGQLKDSTLNSGTNSAVLSYTYQADGVPNTKGMSGVGGAWTEKFDYDNLDRLTSWTPDAGAPLVTYGYNSGGDLTSRTWSGETVTYGPMQVAAGIQTMTVQDQRGTQSTFDAYKFDLLGRALETPAASIVMADDDKPAKVTEANGQVDTLIYDALGNRIMTLYGANGSAGSLVTLDGQFELKRDAARTAATTQARCRLNANGRVVGDVVRVGAGQRTGTFYFEDIVHSVLAEASPDGTLAVRGRRDPFGNTLTSATTPFLPADPTSANPDGSSRLGFGGHDRDNNWGLVDMLARSYSPRLGRFVSPDSLIAKQFDRRDHNPFSYVHNNPVSAFDPTGHYGEAAGGSDGSSAFDWEGPPVYVNQVDPEGGVDIAENPAPFCNEMVNGDSGTSEIASGTLEIGIVNSGISFLNSNIQLLYGHLGPDASVPQFLPKLSYSPGSERAGAGVELGFQFVLGATALASGAGLFESGAALGILESEVGVAARTETFYRTMSPANYDMLTATGKVPATGETFISPSLEYAQQYSGVTVKFDTQVGTQNALMEMGVRNRALGFTGTPYEGLPLVESGWSSSSAYFKIEAPGLVNIGLGQGPALNTFNESIINFNLVPTP